MTPAQVSVKYAKYVRITMCSPTFRLCDSALLVELHSPVAASHRLHWRIAWSLANTTVMTRYDSPFTAPIHAISVEAFSACDSPAS
jgi:hypothetical protein